nr:hypothetical protein [Micromonospora sp. DSM 115978]
SGRRTHLAAEAVSTAPSVRAPRIPPAALQARVRRLLRPSPLSEVVEYEMLMLGVEGKAAGWRTLGTVALSDHRLDLDELDHLHHRARRQAYDLEDLRIQAVMSTFSRH